MQTYLSLEGNRRRFDETKAEQCGTAYPASGEIFRVWKTASGVVLREDGDGWREYGGLWKLFSSGGLSDRPKAKGSLRYSK